MKLAKLEDLFDYLPKSKSKAGDGLKEGKYPFYTSSENQSKYLNDFQHGPGCLVFGTGGKASVHLTTGYFSTSADCITIKPKQNTGIDAGYVFQYLKGNMQVLENGFKGAGLKHISKGYLSDIPIPHPEEITDQIRIAHLLEKVEGLIAQRKQHLQQLDDLLKSVFLEMFGDPLRNEKGWDTKALPELCTKITDGEHLNPQFSPSGMPMVMARNVLDHTVSLRDTKFVEYRLGESFRKKCNPESSDILLVSRGATIGRLCRVDTSEPFCLMGSVILLKPTHKTVNTTFLVAQLKHPSLYWKLFRSSGSSAQQAIYLKDVKRLVCILPPKERQLEFADFSEKVELTRGSYRRALNNLKSLYGALSQQAFKGKLDLSRVPLLVKSTSEDVNQEKHEMEQTCV
jgi:type I restriction enzyme S subunit